MATKAHTEGSGVHKGKWDYIRPFGIIHSYGQLRIGYEHLDYTWIPGIAYRLQVLQRKLYGLQLHMDSKYGDEKRNLVRSVGIIQEHGLYTDSRNHKAIHNW